MDLNFSAEDIAFRDEVRTFIADHYPAGLKAKSEEGEELSKDTRLGSAKGAGYIDHFMTDEKFDVVGKLSAFAESRGVDLQRRNDDSIAVGRPTGTPRLVEVFVHTSDRAALHVNHLQLSRFVDKRDASTVTRPRR